MVRLIPAYFSAIVLSLTTLPSLCFSHNDAAYSHDKRAVANNPNWMSRLRGNKRLGELSLPGTHDSMSTKGGDISKNQTMTLIEQLNSGIRVLDIRTRHINNKFKIYHGIIPQKTDFGEDVLKSIDAFLTANPTETVLFRLRPEYKPSNNTQGYTDTLNRYLAQYGEKRWIPAETNPMLDQVRGKFIILQEFSGITKDGYAYGLPYKDIIKQDKYKMKTNWDLYDKWIAVKHHLIKAKKRNPDTLHMNYLSGAYGSFPYFVASGHSSNGTSAPRLATGLTTPGWKKSYPDFPRVSCFIGICTIAFEGINVLTADYLENNSIDKGKMPGIIMADFPGKRLIENIINQNELSDYGFNEFE
jgi:1-phosphatidylinositol phosphodiesterase